MEFQIAACSDRGIVRKNNQDSFRVKKYEGKNGEAVLAVLCDGVGGLQKGEVASATVVDAFTDWADRRIPMLLHEGMSAEDIWGEWDELIVYQNGVLVNYGKQCEVQLGTTVTALLLTQERYYIAQVGDSRAYLITDDMQQLTNDHSLVAREIALGNLTPEEARRDKRRNILLQCVGATEDVNPDFFDGAITEGMTFLLCSDGFYHELEKDEMVDKLSPSSIGVAEEMQNNLENLIELNKQRQERDNITAIAVLTC